MVFVRQKKKSRSKACGTGNAVGFSLVEVMIASFLVLLVFFGLAQIQMRGRAQLKMSENYRRASLVARSRLESVHSEYAYNGLVALVASDTTYVISGRSFVVSHTVNSDIPDSNTTTVGIMVRWNEVVEGNVVGRSLTCTTIMGKGAS